MCFGRVEANKIAKNKVEPILWDTLYYILYLLYLLSTVSIIYSVSILSKVASPQLHAGPAPGLPDPGEEDEGELALGHPNLDT